jgi:hypothetical protein
MFPVILLDENICSEKWALDDFLFLACKLKEDKISAKIISVIFVFFILCFLIRFESYYFYAGHLCLFQNLSTNLNEINIAIFYYYIK